MHDNCAVSHCGRQTQDVICGSCVDTLIKAILSIVTYTHDDAPTTRLVLVANRGDEVERAPTSAPKKEVELKLDHGGLWEELDVTLTKQHELGRVERAAQSDGSPTLFHEGASDARRTLESTVWYWTYLFANMNQHLTFDPYQATVVEACEWLARFPGLLASLDGAADMLSDFERDTAAAARVVDLHPVRIYLGMCGGRLEVGSCKHHLYTLKGRKDMHCGVCGTEWDVQVRQDALVARVADETVTAVQVSRLLGQIGIEIAPSTIRTYAQHRILKGERQDPKLRSSGKDTKGNPTYRVGDVLELFLKQERKAA
jgi:hypothetical protein